MYILLVSLIVIACAVSCSMQFKSHRDFQNKIKRIEEEMEKDNEDFGGK